MFKKIIIVGVLVVLAGVLLAGAVNRTLAKTGESGSGEMRQNGWGNSRSTSEDTILAGQGGGNGQGGRWANSGDQANGQGGRWASGEAPHSEAEGLPAADPAGLSEEEAQGLLFMREEEKLARDVYTALYAAWGTPVFQNIALSEATHMEAVKTLLDRYGLADPAQAEAGVFTNPDLQALYNELIARGSASLAEALKVGAAIEEIDILDLQTRLTQTDQADIQQVYTNLLRGSSNHLRAFANTLFTQTGETYQPQYLSAEAYAAILDSAGGGYGNGRGGQGNGRGAGGQGGRGARP